MPRKLRDLIRDLVRAGFEERADKGSHRKFRHPAMNRFVIISGSPGDDAKTYQERQVKDALQEVMK